MGRKYDFYETKDKITLVFYKKKNSESDFELLSETKCRYGAEELELYRPVHSPELRETEYVVEVVLKKRDVCRWTSISGPGSVQMPDNKKLYDEQPASEKPSGLLDMLRDIYERSDPDVKRAMNKSMVESNGTVLSTNWDEVKKHTVKPE